MTPAPETSGSPYVDFASVRTPHHSISYFVDKKRRYRKVARATRPHTRRLTEAPGHPTLLQPAIRRSLLTCPVASGWCQTGLGQRLQEQPHCRLHCCISVPAHLDGTGRACSVSSGSSTRAASGATASWCVVAGHLGASGAGERMMGLARACGGATGRVVPGYRRFDERNGVYQEEYPLAGRTKRDPSIRAILHAL